MCSTSPSLTRAWRICVTSLKGAPQSVRRRWRRPSLGGPSTKTFTSPKADGETVGNLYEKEFDEKLEATELLIQPAVDGRGRGKAVRGDRDRQAGEARGTLPRRQPDWRRRRCRARGGGGQAAAAQELTSATTRLATPALPRSRRRRASCRGSKRLYLDGNPNISMQAKDAPRPPCPSVCEF